MRELKFEYMCKDATGDTFTFIKTIEEMERAELNVNTYGMIQEIVSRNQYTTKKDKNDKEIYEGNWLKWNDDFYLVAWNEVDGCWYGEPHLNNINIGILMAYSFKDCEIVGSKFVNKKLTKEAKNEDKKNTLARS